MKTIKSALVAVSLFLSVPVSADQGGELHWARQAGATNARIYPYDVAVLSDGNVAVVGEFWGTASFDDGSSGIPPLVSLGECDGFVAVYGRVGDLLWVRQIGGPYSDRMIQVEEASGNFLVRGRGYGVVSFSAHKPDAISSFYDFETSVQIEYANDGSLCGTCAEENVGDYQRRPRSKDSLDGGCVEAGRFTIGRMICGDSGTGIFLDSEGMTDGSLAEYAADGELSWARKIGGVGDDWSTAISVHPTDAICYAVGVFESTSADFFDGAGASAATLQRVGNADAFVARYTLEDSDRDWLSTLHEGDAGTNELVADSDGDGFYDGIEVKAGTNPLSASSRPGHFDWAFLDAFGGSGADNNSNGIADSDEFALLCEVLSTDTLGVYSAVQSAWSANCDRLGLDSDAVDLAAPISQRVLVAAYMTLGDSASTSYATTYLMQESGVSISTGDYDLSQSSALADSGDANCDGTTNAQHYAAVSGDRSLYLAAALAADQCP